MKVELEVRLPDFKVFDFHLHFPIKSDDWLKPYREKYIKNYGKERWDFLISEGSKTKSWLPSYCFPEPYESKADYKEVAKMWSEEVDKFNLEKVCFLTGGDNETLSKAVMEYPDKFVGFAHHFIEEKNAASKLEKAIKYQGLKGYKILAPTVEKPLYDKSFEDVFEVCDAYNLPVNIHFGILGGGGGVTGGVNINPTVIAEVVKRFPHANFIVPHFGCGFTNDLLRIMWGTTNVFVDTSGNNLWTKWTMENYSLKQLFNKFAETVGASRIIFGSDSEWFPRGFALKYLVDQYQAASEIGLSNGDLKLIFRENAERLLSKVKN